SIRLRPIFAAIAVPNTGKLTWVARHGLSRQDYQRTFDELVHKGLRPLSVSGYRHRQQERYAAIWVKDTHEFGWSSTHGILGKDYLSARQDAVNAGLRPALLNGYPTPTGTRFAAVFNSADGSTWHSRHGLTEAEYQKAIDEYSRKGYRPLWASAYKDRRIVRFNVVFVQEPGKEWHARH